MIFILKIGGINWHSCGCDIWISTKCQLCDWEGVKTSSFSGQFIAFIFGDRVRKKTSCNIDFQLLMESIYFPSIIHGKLMNYLEPMILRDTWMLNPAWMFSGWIQAFLGGDFRLLFRYFVCTRILKLKGIWYFSSTWDRVIFGKISCVTILFWRIVLTVST